MSGVCLCVSKSSALTMKLSLCTLNVLCANLQVLISQIRSDYSSRFFAPDCYKVGSCLTNQREPEPE